MDQEINRIIEDKEKIKWQGVINRNAMIFTLVFSLVIIAIIAGIFLALGTFDYTSNGVAKQGNGLLIGIAILVLGLAVISWNYFLAMVTEYAVTNKRVIVKSGIIGTDFKSIYFDQIQEVLVDVGLIGKLFKVGTIKIDTGKTKTYSTGGKSRRVKTKIMYTLLKHIDKPYDVYKIVQGCLSSRKESLYSGRADRESQS